eukprot:TRINITY_DN65959_c9_g1_i1.p1 TRINITY_DN65959_c9_g1~~TRINITY_DN65959_c9_g1_i1.p1  ORF type:complete len:197 (-),score=86.26 TRINITY_DN65959_c9_g1_i1:69-659(-)
MMIGFRQLARRLASQRPAWRAIVHKRALQTLGSSSAVWLPRHSAKKACCGSAKRSFSAASTASSEAQLGQKEAKFGVPYEEQKMAIVFTCTKCDTRSAKVFHRLSYEHGVVLAKCPGCESLHLVADNKGWFGEDKNIQEMMQQKGVRVNQSAENGTVELVKEDDLELLQEQIEELKQKQKEEEEKKKNRILSLTNE